MTITDYKINDLTLSYEITEKGYDIYLDDKKWISQYEPYIPYPELGYEGSCLKQIEELCTSSVESEEEIEEESTEVVVQSLSETEEAILNTNINVEYLVALQELSL